MSYVPLGNISERIGELTERLESLEATSRSTLSRVNRWNRSVERLTTRITDAERVLKRIDRVFSETNQLMSARLDETSLQVHGLRESIKDVSDRLRNFSERDYRRLQSRIVSLERKELKGKKTVAANRKSTFSPRHDGVVRRQK